MATTTRMQSSSVSALPAQNHQNGQDNKKRFSSLLPSRTVPLVVSTAEAMNPLRRSNMEDVHVVHAPGQWNAPDKDMAYLAVYDGHGGRDTVDFLEHGLSYHVAEELAQNDEGDEVDIKTRLERAFLMADIHARQAGLETSGATVTVCLVKKDQNNPSRVNIISANAGDGRVVLGHLGNAQRLSKDHRLDDPLEVARIEKAGGFVFKGRVMGVLAITRSLGDQLLKKFVIAQPTVKELSIELPTTGGIDEPSFLIIACDGLWDVMSDQEAVDLVLGYGDDKTQVAQFLVKEALRRGTTDNVTVIVAWL